jgi:hypothetical protein
MRCGRPQIFRPEKKRFWKSQSPLPFGGDKSRPRMHAVPITAIDPQRRRSQLRGHPPLGPDVVEPRTMGDEARSARDNQLAADGHSVSLYSMSSCATQLLPRWSRFCAGARLGPAPETSDSWVRHTNQRRTPECPTCQVPLPIRPGQMSNRDCPPRASLLPASGDEME